MNREDIRARISKALDESWGCHHVQLERLDNQVADLGFDSLDMVEARMVVEDEFGVEIDDDSFDACKTVGDIVDLVARRHG